MRTDRPEAKYSANKIRSNSYKEQLIFQNRPFARTVKWHKIRHAGTQVTQCVFQNKGKLWWNGTKCFASEYHYVYLRPRPGLFKSWITLFSG